MNAPFFIAFEGIDGSGKSTQIKNISQKFTENNFPVYTTFEPTDQPIGKMIRTIFSGKMKANEYTIASLFLADRMEHILREGEGMLSCLQKGISVLSDRYYFSSYAYHSVHVPMEWVIEMNKEAKKQLTPTATVFIDISPEESIQRSCNRKQEIEHYETLENLIQVRENYFKAFELEKNTETIICVDGNQSPEKVTEEIWKKIQNYL